MQQVNQFLLWQCVKFMICQKANIKTRKLFIYVYSHVHYYMCCKLKTINAMVSFFSHSVNLWPWVLCVYSHLSGSKCLKMSNDVLSIKSFWTTIYTVPIYQNWSAICPGQLNVFSPPNQSLALIQIVLPPPTAWLTLQRSLQHGYNFFPTPFPLCKGDIPGPRN